MRQAVGEFLRDYPEFRFDLEEYLLASKWSTSLAGRWQRYLTAQTDVSAWVTPATLGFGVDQVASHIAAYRDYRTQDFSSYPTIDKRHLRNKGAQFRSKSFKASDVWHKATSGTTGRPVSICYSPEFYFDLLLLTVRKVAAMSLPGGWNDRPVFCVAITDNASCDPLVLADPLEQVGLTLQVVVDERDLRTFDRLWISLNRWNPLFVTLKPAILEIILGLEPHGTTQLNSGIGLVICSGSNLSESVRRSAERLTGARVVNAYGMTEFGLIACECEKRCGMHVDQSAIYAESMPPERSGDNGSQELVLSSTANEAMPLLRYRTGDLVALETDPCQCGRKTARITEISGRVVSPFKFGDGSTLSPTRFNALFEQFPLREYRVMQTDLDAMRIEFIASSKLPAGDLISLTRDITERVRCLVPRGVDIEARAVEDFDPGKFQRYRIRVP